MHGTKRFDRFFGIHVHVAHEPAWLIGTDRQQREVKRSIALADEPELRMKRGVARKVDAPTARAAEREATPQRVAAVAETARAEVQRGCRGDAERLNRVFLPPVQLRD